MTLFDIIALMILGVSVVVGLARGAMHELTSAGSFVLAILFSIFALRYTGPIAIHSVRPVWAANAVAVAVVFIAAYIVFRVIGGGLTRSVKQTRTLGVLDRLIGGGFGLLRGLVLLGVIGLFLSAVMSPEHPYAWTKSAKLYPLTRVSAATLRAIAPKGSAIAASLKPQVDKAISAEGAADGSLSSASGQSGDSQYSAAAHKALDDVVEKSR